jgi:5-methylcytosine-specific restriction enzyme A
MEIKTISRPWIPKNNWKNRKADTSFYQTSSWKRTRQGFLISDPWIKLPPIGALEYRNCFCADCWEKGKINDQRIEIDHVVRKEDGGTEEFSNLRSRCHKHHSAKSAKESNQPNKL